MKQEQERAGTEATEVAPGVIRMQLPIQMPGLGHVNMYALLDDRGAAIVDTGVPGPLTWRAIEDRLPKAGLKVKDVHTVIITHSHPDHFGTAGRLASEAGADIVTHAAFRMWWNRTAQPHDCGDDAEVPDVHPDDVPTGNPWQGRTPWGGESFRPNLRRRLMFRLMRSGVMAGRFAAPTPTHPLRDGEHIKLAGREWTAVHTPGHTLDHLCLHDPEEGLLISGDHVLPTITPHISGLSTGRDPLRLFVESLDKVAALGQVRRVLPAHGHPFDDLQGRVDHIKHHHEDRLAQLETSLQHHGRASVIDLSHELFRKARWGPMAESETYAHLEHLRHAGRAARFEHGGQLYYELVSDEATAPPSPS